jgi:hypothetical protein
MLKKYCKNNALCNCKTIGAILGCPDFENKKYGALEHDGYNA